MYRIPLHDRVGSTKSVVHDGCAVVAESFVDSGDKVGYVYRLICWHAADFVRSTINLTTSNSSTC